MRFPARKWLIGFGLAAALLVQGGAQPALKREVWVSLTPKGSVQYLRFASQSGLEHRVHAVILDLSDPALELRPVLAVDRATPEELARKYGAIAAINGGFFDTAAGESVSYVTIDGRTASDPLLNLSLITNKELRPYLRRVINRSELRILVNALGQRFFSIVSHSYPVPRGYRLLHALQGGPMLQPELRMIEEGFIRPATSRGRARVAASALGMAARTAVGVLSPQRAVLVMVEKGAPGPNGMTIPQLAAFMRNLGCKSALALDGGSSSSMFFQLDPRQPATVITGRTGSSPAAIKSALLIFSRAQIATK